MTWHKVESCSVRGLGFRATRLRVVGIGVWGLQYEGHEMAES